MTAALVQDAEGLFVARSRLDGIDKKSRDAAFRRMIMIAAFNPVPAIRERARTELLTRFNIKVMG